MDDNRCIYQMIQKELNIGSAAIRKIIHEELHMEKRYDHHIISKIVKGVETYIPFFDVPTRQESKIWVFEDDPMPVMAKNQ
ncbi:UNVERIFIED_CONTAM: hypothetical protein NCL1_62037 [Trichonephila clavipes]